MKVRLFRKKRLLKKAVGPLVPDSILNAEKRGFSMPLAAWLRGELRPMVRDLLSADNIRRQGFFRPEAVRRLIDEHWAGHVDHHRKIWALLVFSLWFDRYAVEAQAGPRAVQKATSRLRLKQEHGGPMEADSMSFGRARESPDHNP